MGAKQSNVIELLSQFDQQVRKYSDKTPKKRGEKDDDTDDDDSNEKTGFIPTPKASAPPSTKKGALASRGVKLGHH